MPDRRPPLPEPVAAVFDRLAALIATDRLEAEDLERLERFIAAGKSGQVVFHVQTGRSMGSACTDVRHRRSKGLCDRIAVE